MRFGQKLREIRNSAGISLKALSSLVGIDRAYLSKVESGKVSPSDRLIKKLSIALNFDRDEMFLLSGRLPDSLLKEVYKNPTDSIKKLKLSIANRIAEPSAPYGRTLITSGDRAIEDGFPFEYISEIAELESYRKEINRPIYHMHKWWAQRLGSVFRAILLSSSAPIGSNIKEMFYQPVRMTGMTVYDPFMGSGTTIGEALKLGCRVIGRDINPVSYFIVKNAFNRYLKKDVIRTYQAIENDVSDALRKYYKTKEGHDVLYYFWVKYVSCPGCKKPVDLFSSYIFSAHAYPSKYPEAKAVCPQCGFINNCRHDLNNLKCKHCQKAFNPQDGPARGVNAICPNCSTNFPIAKTVKELKRPPSHRMYAKLVLINGESKEYQPIDDFDLKLYADASKKLGGKKNPYPVVEILPGHNTNQVLNYNYTYWHQMFNDRQLLCLSILTERIKKIKDETMRLLFTGLFSGILEFNNMFASFKGEGTGAVRHMFSHHILKPERTPLEANLWGTPKSSGSFSTLFQSRILRALDYRENPFELRVERINGKLNGNKVFGVGCSLGSNIADSFKKFESNNLDIYLSCGDSSSTDLPANSVDLVITDPPFFDNVHYSELADFFYVWIRHLFGTEGIFNGPTTRVHGEVQDVDQTIFTQNLSNVFRECNRVLRPEGLLVFTYHHSKQTGWISVLEAIVKSNFVITITHPVKSEMSVAAPKRQAKEPIDLDIIIVCRRRDKFFEESDEPEMWSSAKVSAKEQIVRFNSTGRRLSRNDIRIIFMGQIVSRLSRLQDLDKMKVLLLDYENQIENDIDLLYSQQEAADLKSLNAQTSILGLA